MASTRLRRTFDYPVDDSDDDSTNGLDEEHQDRLIPHLQTKDAANNLFYQRVFLSLPLLASLFFAFQLFTAGTSRQRLLSLLSITSLCATAYTLHYLPILAPDRKGKRAIYRLEAERGPVERYLIPLNAALVGVLLLAAGLSWRRGLLIEAGRDLMPAFVFGIIMFARQQLAPIDLEDLQKAKYDLKGA